MDNWPYGKLQPALILGSSCSVDGVGGGTPWWRCRISPSSSLACWMSSAASGRTSSAWLLWGGSWCSAPTWSPGSGKMLTHIRVSGLIPAPLYVPWPFLLMSLWSIQRYDARSAHILSLTSRMNMCSLLMACRTYAVIISAPLINTWSLLQMCCFK